MANGSRFIGAGAITFALGVLIALPAFSTGATVKNDLRSFEAAPRAAHVSATPTTEPPLHGTNPHGQGTVGVVDLNPSADRPFSADPAGGTGGQQEDIVIGRSRGERRDDGTYHGHVTVAALFGNEIIPGADTGPGQTDDHDILQPLLDALCTPPGGGPTAGICLRGVHVHSATTTTGSTNNFELLGATIGGVSGLPASAAVNVGVARSDGDIETSAACQTTRGASNVADVVLGGVTANVSQSSSQTTACRDQPPTRINNSLVIQLGATGLPVPAAGCANGTPDTVTDLVLVQIVCNADDASNTTSAALQQASSPYGVRDALDVYVLAVGQSALLKLATAASESLAVAPPAPPTTTTPTTTTPTTTTTTTPTTTTPLPTATTPGTPATATDDTGDDESANAGAGDNGGDEGGDNGGGGGGGGGGGAAQCADNVDNDGDGVIDANDPGCHTDGNANNPASYDANDDSEGDGGARLGGGQLPFTGTDVVVLGIAGLILLAAGMTLRGPARRRELGS